MHGTLCGTAAFWVSTEHRGMCLAHGGHVCGCQGSVHDDVCVSGRRAQLTHVLAALLHHCSSAADRD